MAVIRKQRRRSPQRAAAYSSKCIKFSVLGLCLLFWAHSSQLDLDLLALVEERNKDHNLCTKQEESSCRDFRKIPITMVAIPSTGSSTTDKFFKTARSSPIENPCGSDQPVATWSQCQATEMDSEQGTNQIETFRGNCMSKKLDWREKIHLSIDSLQTYRNITDPNVMFTTVRHPARIINSHFKARTGWDRIWNFEYNGTASPLVQDVKLKEWIAGAWWRHNIFTKAYATRSALIWASRYPAQYVSPKPTKEESDFQNSLGSDSDWLKLALERVRAMPFFGIHDRMGQSLELFSFRTCQFAPIAQLPAKREMSAEDLKLVEKYNALDLRLYQEASLIFDDMIEDMRQKKELGWVCDMSHVIKVKNPTMSESALRPFGLRCPSQSTHGA